MPEGPYYAVVAEQNILVREQKNEEAVRMREEEVVQNDSAMAEVQNAFVETGEVRNDFAREAVQNFEEERDLSRIEQIEDLADIPMVDAEILILDDQDKAAVENSFESHLNNYYSRVLFLNCSTH